MKLLGNIAGIAGTEFGVLFAIATAVYLLSGQDMVFDTMQFAVQNF